MALLFESMTPAGVFGSTCEMPMLDLRPLCPDMVIQNMPMFVGRWENNTELPILLDDNYSTTAPEGNCDPTLFTSELITCRVLMPNQKVLYFGIDELPWRETMQAFCDAMRIARVPSLFLPNGTLDPGQPLAEPFIRYLLSDLRSKMMRRYREIFWNGDGSATHQFEGILPQLTEGLAPISGGGGCDDYKAVVIDWNTMTGGSGTAHPEATITSANDSITIHGQTFSGLTGLDLIDFLTLYYERVNQYDFAAYGGVDMWELWVGRGKTNCLAEVAACKQPCDGCTPLSDPMQRERFADYRRNKRIALYPYEEYIPLLESPELGNTVVFAPKMVGGRPMVGWVFRDQDEQLAILNGELPVYGYGGDLPDPTNLYPDRDGFDFDERAFQVDVTKNGICISVGITAEAAVAIFGLGSWLVVQNVDCDALIPTACEDTLSVAVSDVAAVGGSTVQLDLTLASDPTCGTTTGDSVLVSFVNSTALIAEVINYNAGTNVMTLEFEVDPITTTSFGGPSTVSCIGN